MRSKKLLLALMASAMLFTPFSGVATGSNLVYAAEDAVMEGEEETTAQADSKTMVLNYCQSLVSETYTLSDAEQDYYLANMTGQQVNLMKELNDLKDQFGDYKEVTSSDIVEDDNGTNFYVSQIVKYEKGYGKIVMNFYYDMVNSNYGLTEIYVEGLSEKEDADAKADMSLLETVSSNKAESKDASENLANKLKEAGLNTITGILVVFLMLILMAFLISLIKYVNVFGKKKEEEEKPVPVIPGVNASTTEDVIDDTQLIAVIAAAIAASQGTSTDGFVVRSIKKRR